MDNLEISARYVKELRRGVIDADDLRRKGWLHITDLGGPHGVYSADWCLPAMDDTKWWPYKNAATIQKVIDQNGGQIPPVEVMEEVFRVIEELSPPSSAERGWPEHLRDDAPFVMCDICRRKSWGGTHGALCQMPQPNGARCEGVLLREKE